MSHRTRNGAFQSKRTSYAPTNFEERTFNTREARDAFWEAQMLKHPHVVRDTGTVMKVVSSEGAEVKTWYTIWRVRWPR